MSTGLFRRVRNPEIEGRAVLAFATVPTAALLASFKSYRRYFKSWAAYGGAAGINEKTAWYADATSW